MIIFGVVAGKLLSGGHAIVRLEVACQEPEGHVRGAMHSGQVIIGFDGQPASELALREAEALFAPRPAQEVTPSRPRARIWSSSPSVWFSYLRG